MKLPIKDIYIGVRRRDHLGDVKGLALSIKKRGLIHPIIVNGQNVLVAGERRLKAHEMLGLTDIEARRVSDLAPEELRAIEFDENTQRKDLTEREKAKRNAELLREQKAANKAAEEAAKGAERAAEAEAGRFTATTMVKAPRKHRVTGGKSPGRPARQDSTAQAARALGMPVSTAQKTLETDEYLKRYPLLDRPEWSKASWILNAGKLFDALPDAQRMPIVGLLDQRGGLTPSKILQMAEQLSAMTVDQRNQIIEMSQGEPRDLNSAIAQAAGNPPPTDERIALYHEISNISEKWVRAAEKQIDKYPNDKENDPIRECIGAAKQLFIEAQKVLAALRQRMREQAV